MSKITGITEDILRVKQSEEVKVWQDRVAEKDKILADYKKEHGQLEAFFRQVRSAISPIKPETIYYRPSGKKKVESPCVAVMQASDGHYGSVQNADEIEGFNAFNPDICERRQIGFVNDVIQWVEIKRSAYTINEIAFLVTGDMISGDIHDELRVTNAMPSPVQAVNAGKLLAKQIAMLAPHFSIVSVHFIVEDNHGRLTKKPQAKEAGLNTFNYVVGEIARSYIADHKNVIFNIYPMSEKVIQVSTRQYLITHGHTVRGWMGVPWYGVERKVAREAVARMQVIMDDMSKAKTVGFHKYVFGHWHTPVDMPLYSCAGSVSGTDAYDHQAGRYARPSQPAWMVHPRHGEFDRTNFWME